MTKSFNSAEKDDTLLQHSCESASLVHLVDAPHWSGVREQVVSPDLQGNTSCHRDLNIPVTVTRRANAKVRLTLNFFVLTSEALPSLLVPFG